MTSPEIVILRSLLEKEQGFVSGAVLAESLRMSRVAVWQYMEKLRDQGFEFQAVRARGYRLIRKPVMLNRLLIEAYLSLRQLSFGFDCLEEVDSTNDEALRQLSAGRATPFVVMAKKQTRGRGRFGRTWHSEANGNLYVSFAFRPQVEPARMQTFTLWMGVNICDLIASFTQSDPGLKWPNDILFDQRKAGGMLTEARMDSDQIRDLVFGLGLNTSSRATAWPAELSSRAVSLAEQTRTPVDINRFAAALVERVLVAYDQFLDNSYQESFADSWNRYDLLRGKPVSLLQGTRHIRGVALGIDDEGSLIVKGDNGKTERFRAGEVTIEKKPAAALA